MTPWHCPRCHGIYWGTLSLERGTIRCNNRRDGTAISEPGRSPPCGWVGERTTNHEREMEMEPRYKLQRCRSHNVNDTPQAWETIRIGSESEIVGQLLYHRKRNASGDSYRIIDMDGEEQSVLTPTTCGPTY